MSVALMKTPLWPQAGLGTVAAMEKAAQLLQKEGIRVQDVAFPPEIPDSDTLQRIQEVIRNTEAQV